MKTNILLILFSLAVSIPTYADIAVIVNKNNNSIWDKDGVADYIKNIFLNAKEKFPDGTPAKPLDQSQGREIRQNIYLKLAGKNETKMNVYWSNLIFTGNGRPPLMAGNDSDIKKVVSEDSHGIGYIDSSAVDNTVKVIYTLK